MSTDEIREWIDGSNSIRGVTNLRGVFFAILDKVDGLEREIQELRDDANRRANPEDE